MPKSQCLCMGCSSSTYEPPGCTLTVGCERRDSVPAVDMGSWQRFDSDPVECEYCPACCDDPPCSCQGLPAWTTCDQAKIEGEDVISNLALASCLGTDLGVIERALFAACFVAGGTYTQCCDAAAGLCTRTTTKAFIYMWFGAKATMDHEWQMVRVYTGPACGLTGRYTTPCGGATSGVVADVVDRSSSGCEVVTAFCGPVCP